MGTVFPFGFRPTTPKIHMEPKDDAFQKESSPFPGTYFQVPCWISGEYLVFGAMFVFRGGIFGVIPLQSNNQLKRTDTTHYLQKQVMMLHRQYYWGEEPSYIAIEVELLGVSGNTGWTANMVKMRKIHKDPYKRRRLFKTQNPAASSNLGVPQKLIQISHRSSRPR